MGCNSSKVSKTHVEIIRLRQEVKSSVKWRKTKEKETKERPNSEQASNSLAECPTNSPQSSSSGGNKELDRQPSYETVNDQHKVTKPSPQDLLPRNQLQRSTESLETCENFLLSASVGSDEGRSFTGFGLVGSRPPSGRKSRMTNDLTVEEIEDSSDLSHELDVQLTRPKTGRSTSTVGHHVPLNAHSAWSDFSVRLKNTFFAPKTKVKEFRGSDREKVEGSSLTSRRNRPMAAKGERKKPELTEVYGAELSIPGTIIPNPKQQQEERCLNAWMARRLGDQC